MDPASDLAARLDSMPSVYGNIQLVYLHTAFTPDGGSETTGNDFADNGSTIGFQHKHEIAPGIEGFLKAEFEFAADNKAASGGLNGLDEAYMGVRGNFGSVLIGTEDTVYENVDVVDMFEAVGISGGLGETEEGDQLQYMSPALGDAVTIGVSLPLTNASTYMGQIVGMFSSDMVDVALGYTAGKDQPDVGTAFGDSVGISATVKVQDLSLKAQYETKTADAAIGGADDLSTEADFMAVMASYSLGASSFTLGYSMLKDGQDGAAQVEENLLYLQALHNLSDIMYAYVEFLTGGVGAGGNDDAEALALGAAYVF
jgi:predicted porin